MGKIIFIIGGARSGKSAYAQKYAQERYKKVVFIPTCKPLDNEMKKRVALHKASRPSYWKTIEKYRSLSATVKKAGSSFELIMIDCLTLWVSSFVLRNEPEKEIILNVQEVIKALKKNKADAVIVSNETGMGIVPDNKMARDFRDSAGRVNQRFAQAADKVYCMFAGLPCQLK